MSDDEIDPRFQRYRTAYLAMNEHARYRPVAPGDGLGNVELDAAQQRDPVLLAQEADRYAVQMINEDNAMDYTIGCPDFAFNRAFCWALEAVRLLCSPAPVEARKLLEMTIKEIDAEMVQAIADNEFRAVRGGFVGRPWRERFKALNPGRKFPAKAHNRNSSESIGSIGDDR